VAGQQFWKYNYDTDNWMSAPVYRRPSFAPNTKKFWFEDAACQSLPAELFEPAFGAGTREETIKANEDKFAQARRACNGCPVWHMCYKNAEPGDFYYTMRAGVEPVQFTIYKEQGLVRDKVSKKRGDITHCAQGHNDWRMWGKKNPRRKCATCARENGVVQRAKKTAVQ